MNIHAVDLNLLLVFHAMLEHRNVTRAGESLNLSQPAMSAAAQLAQEAPGVNLRTLAMPRHAAAESLESGAAELALGFFPDLHKTGFFSAKPDPLAAHVRGAQPAPQHWRQDQPGAIHPGLARRGQARRARACV